MAGKALDKKIAGAITTEPPMDLALRDGNIEAAGHPDVNVRDIVSQILPRGHVIHGYSTALNTRLLMVLESKDYSDDAPLLGYGQDGQAERALARALLTYALREQDGKDYIEERTYPASYKGEVWVGENRSRFDNIVWGGDFWLYQEGEEVRAGSRYGGGHGLDKLEVSAPDALGAIVLLTERYNYMNATRAMSVLPPIAL
jgi:hypothetical protein